MRPLYYDKVLWGIGVAFLVWEGFASPGLTYVHQGFMGAIFLLFGLTHGALDHYLLLRIKPLSLPVFLGVYVSLMGFMALLWYLHAELALLVFLGLSIYHFGELEARNYGLQPKLFFAFLIGSLIVCGPLLCHPNIVGRILESMYVCWPLPGRWFGVQILATLLGANLLITAVSEYKNKLRIMAKLSLWTVMFVVLHPLLSFILYFGLWHSVTHFIDVPKNGYRKILLHVAVYGLPAILGVMTLAVYWSEDINLIGMSGVILMSISVLTVPHMLVVEYQHQVSMSSL